LREPLLTTPEQRVREPVDMWFGSVFSLLAHICSGEAGWLARMRDRATQSRALNADSFPNVASLVERWRDLDAQWEAYVGSLSAQALEENVVSRRSDGNTYAFKLWQPVIHVANHSTE